MNLTELLKDLTTLRRLDASKAEAVAVAPLFPRAVAEIPVAQPVVEVRPIRVLPSVAEMLQRRVDALTRELAMERMRVAEMAGKNGTDGADRTDDALAERLARATEDLEREREKVGTLMQELDRLGDEVVDLRKQVERQHAQLVTKAAEAERQRERAEAAISREAEAVAKLAGVREYDAPPVREVGGRSMGFASVGTPTVADEGEGRDWP